MSQGKKFRALVAEALEGKTALPIVGTINAYTAILAKRAGHKAIYLSGAGVANASFGMPDLAVTSLNDVVEDARRITAASELPLLVDIDTGWGGAFNIARTIKEMCRAEVAAVHIEDQVMQKRCGHRPNKAIVTKAEMIDRVKAAADAKTDSDFVIMARTDALAVEGLDSALERAVACVDAGADMIFAEAMTDIGMYKQFVDAVKVPVLANITEFGQTPLYSQEQLAEQGVSMALYPLSAFRAMSAAALSVYQTIADQGTQESVVGTMQTRMDLYDCLGYHEYEKKLDDLFSE